MIVQLAVQFSEITPENEDDLRTVAFQLTDDREKVRVFPLPDVTNWLAVEFSIPKQRQIDAVDRIDRCFEFQMLDRLDSFISFPNS